MFASFGITSLLWFSSLAHGYYNNSEQSFTIPYGSGHHGIPGLRANT
jgi:hypothetical protein